MAITCYVLLFALLCIINHFCPSVLVYPSVVRYIHHARFRRKHGTAAIAEYPQREKWYGLDMLTRQIVVLKSATYLREGFLRYELLGKTWVGRLAFNDWYNTIEPENLKFILQMGFENFGLGTRLKSFGPLLGEGIFTTGGLIYTCEDYADNMCLL